MTEYHEFGTTFRLSDLLNNGEQRRLEPLLTCPVICLFQVLLLSEDTEKSYQSESLDVVSLTGRKLVTISCTDVVVSLAVLA